MNPYGEAAMQKKLTELVELVKTTNELLTTLVTHLTHAEVRNPRVGTPAVATYSERDWPGGVD